MTDESILSNPYFGLDIKAEDDFVTERSDDGSITIDILSDDFAVSEEGVKVIGDGAIEGITLGAASYGEVVLNDDGTVTYIAGEDFRGSDSFTYSISGPYLITDTATVYINIANDAPTISDISVSTDEDNSILVDVLASASDADDDSITIHSVDAPFDGTVEIVDGKIKYTPNPDFTGIDFVIFQITDGTEIIAASINIHVKSVDDEVVVNYDIGYLDRNESIEIDILANDLDVDGRVDLETLEIGSAQTGVATLNADGTVSYTPKQNFVGYDKFTYQIADIDGVVQTSIVHILIGMNGYDLRVMEGVPGDMIGTDSAEYVMGTEGSDLVLAGDGHDYITTLSGDDQIYGELGNDRIRAGDGVDYIEAGEGGDYVYGGNGNDTILGENGRDYLYGDSGSDIIFGGAGEDFLFGGENDDQLSGGDDSDTLYGGSGNDLINGDSGNDTLWGEAGNDILYGGLGADTLFAGAGDNELYGEDGNDSLLGSFGKDYLSGGAGADYLYGGDNVDILHGGLGNDNIVAGKGDDELFGEEGSDNLIGNEGNDKLVGGAGNDRLKGGSGADYLYGGDGDDLFDYSSYLDSKAGSSDIIADFEKGKDKVDFSEYIDIDEFSDLEITQDEASNKTKITDKSTETDLEIELIGLIDFDTDDFNF